MYTKWNTKNFEHFDELGGLLQNPQKQLKTAKNSKILITSLRCWPTKSIACRNILVLQIFYSLYELSKIKFSHFVCIHKAHFSTPKNQMLTREKSKFEQFFDNFWKIHENCFKNFKKFPKMCENDKKTIFYNMVHIYCLWVLFYQR